MDFTKHLDETKTVDAKTVVDSSTPWKDRIVQFMINSKEAALTDKEILEATDPNYNTENFENRKHCLDSQFTYIRKDFNIRTKKVDNKTVLLGIQREDKLTPFKNAVKYL